MVGYPVFGGQARAAAAACVCFIRIVPDLRFVSVGGRAQMGGVSSGHPLSTFIWEFIITAFVVYVVFATQVDKQTRHDFKISLPAPFAPLAVGLAVAVGAFASVPYTGGAMNPLR